MKPRVYVETTIVSYLTARPSRDVIIAAHQQITDEWWKTKSQAFELFASQLVLREAQAGNEEMAKLRLEALANIKLLAVTEEALMLAQKLINNGSSGDSLLNSISHEAKPNLRFKSERVPRGLC